MNSITKTLAAAAMGAVGVLTLVNVASAQTTTTETPAVEAPADNPAADNPGADNPGDTAADDHNCPERDGAGSDSGSGTTDSTGAAGSNIGFRRL
jgi:hypothetical protein